MTGRELIIYILSNNLENETIPWFVTDEELAVKCGIGIESVRTMIKLGALKAITINGKNYILPSETSYGVKVNVGTTNTKYTISSPTHTTDAIHKPDTKGVRRSSFDIWM